MRQCNADNLWSLGEVMRNDEPGLDDLAAFVRERDEALLSGDVERVRNFHTKWNPGIRPMPREVAEVAMHKARTAAMSLPVEAREASEKWLADRGFESLA